MSQKQVSLQKERNNYFLEKVSIGGCNYYFGGFPDYNTALDLQEAANEALQLGDDYFIQWHEGNFGPNFVKRSPLQIFQSTSAPSYYSFNGIKGIKQSGEKWLCYISAFGKNRYLGSFSSFEEAADIRKKAEKMKAKDIEVDFILWMKSIAKEKAKKERMAERSFLYKKENQEEVNVITSITIDDIIFAKSKFGAPFENGKAKTEIPNVQKITTIPRTYRGTYCPKIYAGGKNVILGYFEDLNDAASIRKIADNFKSKGIEEFVIWYNENIAPRACRNLLTVENNKILDVAGSSSVFMNSISYSSEAILEIFLELIKRPEIADQINTESKKAEAWNFENLLLRAIETRDLKGFLGQKEKVNVINAFHRLIESEKTNILSQCWDFERVILN